MLDLVIGVDGGQTSCKCVLADTGGRVLGYGDGGPLIHLAAEGGRERFVQVLREALGRAWQVAGIAPQPVAAIGLGLSGVEAGTVEARTVVELIPRVVDTPRVDVQNDGVAALMGAHLGAAGVVVISGTGCIALGIDAQGRQAFAGGWAWLVGDPGSAFAIARGGLAAAFSAYDGTGPATALEAAFVSHFKVPTMYDVKREIYAGDPGPRSLAALAPLVAQAAANGDPAAHRVIQSAAEALAGYATAVIRRLEFVQANVATAGGAFEHLAGLRAAFTTAVRSGPIPAQVVAPRLPPVLGGAIMALKLCPVDWRAVAPRLTLPPNR